MSFVAAGVALAQAAKQGKDKKDAKNAAKMAPKSAAPHQGREKQGAAVRGGGKGTAGFGSIRKKN